MNIGIPLPPAEAPGQLLDAAKRALRAGQAAEAEAGLLRLLEQRPAHVEALASLVAVTLRRGAPGLAVTRGRAALARRPH
uniref:hypothetical protein n=1 Tax=Oceanicella sp. SM1341 TaxID=1548889 RepID=UPI0018E4F1B1